MITLEELNPHAYPLSLETQANLLALLDRLNEVRAAWGRAMIVTSGLRSPADQARINPRAPQSRHLTGQAVDILDEGLELTAWLKANPEILKNAGLWCEDGNKNWVHFQSCPPRSGKRWFLP